MQLVQEMRIMNPLKSGHESDSHGSSPNPEDNGLRLSKGRKYAIAVLLEIVFSVLLVGVFIWLIISMK